MPKVKMNLGGNVVEAESIAVSHAEEPWSTYRLDDGSVIKLKLVVSDVFKLPQPDPVTGLPQYLVRSSNVLSVEPPETPLSKREIQ
jgi:hypothetical protein